VHGVFILQPQLLNIRAVCELVSLSHPTIYRQVVAGKFPQPVKIGRASRWHMDQVAAWIAQLGSKDGETEGRAPNMEGSGHD
jgi:prophage regulatory protein